MSIDDLNIAEDKLRGAAAIAEFLGEPPERVRYLIRRRLIPFYREGANIVASRRVLREHHLTAAKGRSDEPEAA